MLDATDARLLLALAEDPRASVMALSQRLGLARNTVQARLTRLEQAGALAPFDRRVLPEALGYRLAAYVTVQVVQRSLAEVSDGLAHIPEVLGVTGLSGVADLLVQVVARTPTTSGGSPSRCSRSRRAADRHRSRAAAVRRPPRDPAAGARRRGLMVISLADRSATGSRSTSSHVARC